MKASFPAIPGQGPAATQPPLADLLHSCLERVRLRILQAMQDTPTPIPACDQHFNRLLELREQVAQLLRTLRELEAQAPPAARPAADRPIAIAALAAQALDNLPPHSEFLLDGERAELRSAIQAWRIVVE